MAVRDDLLPTQDAPDNGARIQVTDKLAASPVTVNGPTIEADPAIGRLALSGVEVGDTGQRAVTPLNGWTAAELKLSRVAGLVTLTVRNLDGAAATDTEWLTLPDGFKAITVDVMLGVVADWNLNGVSHIYAPDNRGLRLANTFGVWLQESSRAYGTLVWPTNDPWPTTLPGAAA